MNLDNRTNLAVKFLNPDEIISKLEILSGMKVAHFGCGTGFFTFSVAKKVGDDGLVYAVDIQPSKIETMQSQAKMLGLNNIDAFRANLEEKATKIKSESVDWVFIINMLYQNKKKQEILAEAQRVLKAGGKILLIDWENKDQSFGPEMSLRVSQDELSVIIGNNDLAIWKKINVGNFHFGWILKK
ncbi:MAG: methyltransferase domain-containing protein [Parcubacteria group bacterium]|jgi:ubiquinone/menaquinone biosynthesis C-methylase UbiE